MKTNIIYKGFGICLALLLLLTTVPAYAEVEEEPVPPREVEEETEEYVVNPYDYLYFDVYTDENEYRTGEEARITAVLTSYSSGYDVEEVDVWATVEYPNGVKDKIRLRSTLCSMVECECPKSECWEGEICPEVECLCRYEKSCYFENEVGVDEEGTYYVYAYAEGRGFSLTEKMKFWAYESRETQYVRMDQKFELDVDDSAVVVDYGDMRLTLDDIMIAECTYEAPENEPKPTYGYEAVEPKRVVECIGGPAYAVLTVRGPVSWEKVSEDEAEEMAYTETQVRIKEGGSTSVFGAKISFIESHESGGLFIVSNEVGGNYVKVKIEPSGNSVELGDKTKYQITIKDLHIEAMTAKAYDYKIRVLDLPFSMEYQDEVRLGEGQELSIPLYVYTSSYGYAESVAPKEVAKYSTKSRIVVSEEVMEKVEIAPEVTASGRSYKFRVIVTGDDGSQATAYAILNVLYSPPPPPVDEVKMGIQEGWNLITLPGQGDLSQGTCSNELYAFVYIKERNEYMNLEEATDYMGESRLKEYLRLNAFWVYSFSDCTMYFELEKATSYNELELDDGWNFVPITQDMRGNSLSEIGGDCDFERTYYWDAVYQEWAKLDPYGEFGYDMLYKGFVAKVEDYCSFGWGAVLTPPPLPE